MKFILFLRVEVYFSFCFLLAVLRMR